MKKAISMYILAAYLAITGTAQKLLRDERGLSGVVVAILLILVAVLAVVLIWTFLGEWLKDLWQRVTDSGELIEEYTV